MTAGFTLFKYEIGMIRTTLRKGIVVPHRIDTTGTILLLVMDVPTDGSSSGVPKTLAHSQGLPVPKSFREPVWCERCERAGVDIRIRRRCLHTIGRNVPPSRLLAFWQRDFQLRNTPLTIGGTFAR